MTTGRREEVLNTVLSEVIVAQGIDASPETIHRRGRARPDVFINFRGLRCAVEGKIADTPNAHDQVFNDATRRLEKGIAQIAIAVVYPQNLKYSPFRNLYNEIQSTQLDFCLLSELSTYTWQNGDVALILAGLRRSHDSLASDDAVRRAADELATSLEEVANVFLEDRATADRLIDTLGIGQPETKNDDTNSR